MEFSLDNLDCLENHRYDTVISSSDKPEYLKGSDNLRSISDVVSSFFVVYTWATSSKESIELFHTKLKRQVFCPVFYDDHEIILGALELLGWSDVGITDIEHPRKPGSSARITATIPHDVHLTPSSDRILNKLEEEFVRLLEEDSFEDDCIGDELLEVAGVVRRNGLSDESTKFVDGLDTIVRESAVYTLRQARENLHRKENPESAYLEPLMRGSHRVEVTSEEDNLALVITTSDLKNYEVLVPKSSVEEIQKVNI